MCDTQYDSSIAFNRAGKQNKCVYTYTLDGKLGTTMDAMDYNASQTLSCNQWNYLHQKRQYRQNYKKK